MQHVSHRTSDEIARLKAALTKAADELAACAEAMQTDDGKAQAHAWARQARAAAEQ